MSTPAVAINGTLGAYEQPVKFGIDSTGPYCIRTWRGTAYAINEQYNWCVQRGGLAEVEAGFGTLTLRARFAITLDGGHEVPVDTWEFFASHVEKDILEADVPALEAISKANKERIRDYIANPDSYTGESDPFLDDGPNSQVNALGLHGLMLDGVRSVRVNAPCLRHTQTVSNLYTVKAALANVGSILATGTLYDVENIPGDTLFSLPASVSSRAGRKYGWLKLHPTIRTAARQRMQIEIEYEYGLWATLIYGDPI